MRECTKAERFRRNPKNAPLNPKSALRKILILIESHQFREASNVLLRIAPNSISILLDELPMDLFLETLPHSAQFLEIVFQKLLQTNEPKIELEASPILWQLVKLLSIHQEDKVLKNRIIKLSQVLIKWQPNFQKGLVHERRLFDKAVQGLGFHGLIQNEAGLTPLYSALKSELQRHIEAYKQALVKIDEFGLANKNQSNPTDVSHHRLLSLTYADIQERLIENKTILTVLDKPALKQLQPLIENLESRVQLDKEALFCVSQLKKYTNRFHTVPDDKPVATILMSFSNGCSVFLNMVQQQDDCDQLSASEGYHSENDTETEQRKELLQQYRELFRKKRLKVLEALDEFADLKSAFQLKNKIIFSVIVLSFRLCRSVRNNKLKEIIEYLHVEPKSKVHGKVTKNLIECLQSTSDSYPLDDIEHQVLDLLCNTLNSHDFLRKADNLKNFIGQSTRICWNLVNFYYEMDTQFTIPCLFETSKHQQYSNKILNSSSNSNSSIVKLFLWPGLIFNQKIVERAIVEIGI